MSFSTALGVWSLELSASLGSTVEYFKALPHLQMPPLLLKPLSSLLTESRFDAMMLLQMTDDGRVEVLVGGRVLVLFSLYCTLLKAFKVQVSALRNSSMTKSGKNLQSRLAELLNKFVSIIIAHFFKRPRKLLLRVPENHLKPWNPPSHPLYLFFQNKSQLLQTESLQTQCKGKYLKGQNVCMGIFPLMLNEEAGFQR